MKIRIKGNSVRYRLSRTDVATLARNGYLEEVTSFGSTRLVYALQEKVDADNQLSASFRENKITIQLPRRLLSGWEHNDVVGFDSHMPLEGDGSLYLLVEKDFKCLDDTNEDQSDNFDNPNQTC